MFINGANEPNHDFGFATSPTAALLGHFNAFEAGGGVQVEWRTVSQVGPLGFCSDRPEAGEYLKVNDSLLPARVDAPQGATYRLRDPLAVPGTEQVYWLLEIEAGGGERWHGPFAVIAEESANEVVDVFDATPLVSSLDVARRARLEREAQQEITSRTRPQLVPPSQLRVEVDRAGVYFVSDGVLASGLGEPLATVQGWIAGHELRLRKGDQEVTWWSETGSGLYFFAQQPDSLYSDGDRYMTETETSRSAFVEPTQPARPYRGELPLDRALRRGQLRRTASIHEEGVEFWFWSALIADDPSYGSQVHAFTLTDPVSDPTAVLKLRVFGATQAADNPDHGLVVYVNGFEIGQVSWDGAGAFLVEMPFDGTLLTADNQLTDRVDRYRRGDRAWLHRLVRDHSRTLARAWTISSRSRRRDSRP